MYLCDTINKHCNDAKYKLYRHHRHVENLFIQDLECHLFVNVYVHIFGTRPLFGSAISLFNLMIAYIVNNK